MHILFLTDNFPPETNAPASRTYEHAVCWVAAGHKVTVLTGAPNFPRGKVYSGYSNALWRRETIDGIDVIRVWTYIAANEGFVRRTIDYLSFMVSAIVATPFLPRPDVIVATSPQFFTPCAAWVVSLLRRRPFVFELRDLWPDSIVAVGAMREGMALRLLRRLEYWLYARADRIVSVTNAFKGILVANGVPEEKIDIVRNGVDLKLFVPGPRPSWLARSLGVEGKFVAAYVGTLGMAHGLGTLLSAAAILGNRKDLAFLLIGDGADRDRLEARAKELGLSNVIFVGAVDKERVRECWKLCSVALVLLKDTPLFRHVIPSKMFEAMATARPIILGVQGESAEVLAESGAGIAIAPENPEALARAIESLMDDPRACGELGAAGRRFVEQRFDRNRLGLKMLEGLEAVVSGSPGR